MCAEHVSCTPDEDAGPPHGAESNLVTRRVRRRLVMFFCGFDPQGPAHYHQMYLNEAAKQGEVSGWDYRVGKRVKAGDHIAAWNIHAEKAAPAAHAAQASASAEAVETRFEFLRWDDIVRAHWPRGRWGLLKTTAFASWNMWRNGVMWQTLKTSWPMFIAIGLPGALMLALGAVAGCLLLLAAWMWRNSGPLGAVSLVLVGMPALAWLAVHMERRSHMAWLMRSLACLVRQGRNQTPELELRLHHFADHLAAEARNPDWDELLLVGHSSGAMMAMIVMARAQQQLREAKPPLSEQACTKLSLLTLGHCAPLLSEQPEAHGFRTELRALTTNTSVTWVDFGAPPDGCCFPLIDPTAPAYRAARQPDLTETLNRPKLLNPRFAKLIKPENYRTLRSDKFRCHFQYLMASEITGVYDYFAATAGPMTLSDRYAPHSSQVGFRQFELLGGPGH